MKGIRIEIKTPVQNGPGKPIMYYRKTNYFFSGLNKTPKTGVKGEHWFFDTETGYNEACLLLEEFWEYCVIHNRTNFFDTEVRIRYERIPLKNTFYVDGYQFVRSPA